MKDDRKFSTNVLVKLALMTALSVVLLFLIRIPFPPAPFLVYDPADIPVYITAFAFGPVPGLLVTFIVSFLQAFVMGGDSIYGFVMHFVATGALAFILGLIYERNKTKKTAIQALIVGGIVSVAIMCVLNIFITPVFMGAPRKAVIAMIIPVIIPFNLLKVGINGLVTFVLYKRMSRFLHNEENITGKQRKKNKSI